MSNFTTVSGSNITDLKSNKLALGSISFTATDAMDQPISFQIGGGGQAVRGPVTSPVIAGVITSFTVPDPASTLPTGIYYRVTVTDSSTGKEVLRYTLVSFTGLTFNFDNYFPTSVSAGAPLSGNTVTGNLGVTGNVAATGTVTGSNIAGGQIATGTGTTNTLPKYTNGGSAVLGNSSITDDGTTVSTSEALSVGGQVVGKNGAVGSPSFTFASSLTTGFWRQAADVIGASVAGVLKWLINSAGLLFGSGQTIGFSSNTDPSAAVSDTGISRAAANAVAVGNGTAGDNTGNVRAGSYYINAGAGGVWNFITAMFDQISTGGVRWSSGANATTGIDTGVTRGGAAATVAIGNGTAGNASGTLKVAKLNNGADLALPTTAGTIALGVLNFQKFTANGTFTIPTGVTAVKVTVIGGGGAGGGSTTPNNGAGGAAGAAAFKWLSGLTPGNTIAVTVGGGGAGVSGAGGGNGVASSIASGTQTIGTVTANGGSGGVSTGVLQGGGSQATATGGDINMSSNGGGATMVSGLGGFGGASILGGGAQAGTTASGGAPGAGGSGSGSGSTAAGGSGAAGIVIFEWAN